MFSDSLTHACFKVFQDTKPDDFCVFLFFRRENVRRLLQMLGHLHAIQVLSSSLSDVIE